VWGGEETGWREAARSPTFQSLFISHSRYRLRLVVWRVILVTGASRYERQRLGAIRRCLYEPATFYPPVLPLTDACSPCPGSQAFYHVHGRGQR